MMRNLMVDLEEDNVKKYLEHLMNSHKVYSQGSIDFAISVVKILLLVNGVALVSLLTFTGGFDLTGKNIGPGEVENFFMAFIPFIIGIILAALAATFSYLHQNTLEEEVHNIIYYALFHPGEDHPKKGWRIKTKNSELSVLGVFAIIFILLSTLSFAYGAWAVLEALKAMHLVN